ncbi:MAG TPA: hypothetical protein VFG22_10490, partial [Polyangiales bacterium]|nr:hypothetical protein [Polyangiales bacterium]
MSNNEPPDEWHEIVSLIDDAGETLPTSDPHPQVWVRGSIGEITIVQVEHPGDIQGVSRLLKDAGIEKTLIVPRSVRFMRLR